MQRVGVSRRVVLLKQEGNPRETLGRALELSGILERVSPSTRVAIKPNLTYPYHKPGVTTSPAVLREVISVLKEHTGHIAVVESNGGYGAWSAEEAFEGHGLFAMGRELGIEIVNLCNEAREMIAFQSRGCDYRLPLPSRLIHDTDLLITMPVPKVHAMTGLSLSYKNQWGCIPDDMRLRKHHVLNDALVAINRALRPVVVGDGTHFLDRNGPLDGDPVRMDLIISASDAGAFDRYVSELMGFSWRRIAHLRRAADLGDMATDLKEIIHNVPPSEARTHVFRLRRTPRNWIALAGFNSSFLTWLGYESWFGRVVLHAALYAIAGKPVKPQPVSTE